MTLISDINLFKRDPQLVAGTLLFLAGFIVIMGIITAEIFYPYEYTTSDSMISDLGSTHSSNDITIHPSAIIFNLTMIIAGIMALISAYCMFLLYKKLIFNISFSLFGLGVLGVGIFPGNVKILHPIFALITFISGGIAAIASSKIIEPPYGHISLCIGGISLLFLVSARFFIPILGSGGTERWIVYPLMVWSIGFGAYLLGTNARLKK